MTPAELFSAFREDIVDKVAPYLWTTAEVYRYMADAQNMLCRKIGGFQDATSAITELAVATGEKWSPFSEKILRVKGATLRSTGRDLKVYNYEDYTGGHNFPVAAEYMNTAGTVRAIVLGMDERNARIVQVPEADDTIDLVLERLPLDAPGDDAELEVDELHHPHLLMWMKHLAYAKQGAETYDKARSTEEAAKFLGYCAQVNDEKKRRISKPRLMAYGGI